MADSFVKTYKFLKGIYEASFFQLGTRNLLMYSNKLMDGNFSSTVNMGEITASVGNPVVIQLPDSAKFGVTLTSADVDLIYNQLNTGGTLGYNGITKTCEVITATATTLTITGTPVVPYGATSIVGYVNGGGTAYTIDATTKIVTGFTATVGTQYTVTYYVSLASNQYLDVKSLFAPVIGTLEVKFPVFSAVEGSSANTGTHVGNWHVIVPRFQFSGEGGGINSNQTTPATGVLNGQALAYSATSGTTCDSGTPSLIYMVYEPLNTTEGITDMVVLNGGDLSVAVGATATIPVRFVMADGILSVPDYSQLTFVSAASSTASVTAGVVTGAAAGSTEITITYAGVTPSLTASCQVDVTAS